MINQPQILKMLNFDTPLLLLGESGTGKSRLAKQIHQNSKRKDRPFLTVHLASLNEALIESELFGHVKGAFTSAFNEKQGACELVGTGTLFLDEIGEISLETQKKLLFLLEERQFHPVGSTCNKIFAGKIIAATNKNLREMVTKKTFREDLYYRLMVHCHLMPSLRDDPAHLKNTLHNAVEAAKVEHNKHHLKLSPELLSFLENYSWPGNMRELLNAVENIISLGDYRATLANLPIWMRDDLRSIEQAPCSKLIKLSELPVDYHQAVEICEKSYLNHVLDLHNGKINQTAKNIKISKATLIHKIKKYKINAWEMREQNMAA